MSQELVVAREREFSYRICFHDSFSQLAEELDRDQIHFYRVCIVTDNQVDTLYAKQIEEALQGTCHTITKYSIPAGESYKTLDTIKGIYTHLIENNFDRKDMLIALGGGVVGDMTGYTAATYLRGIRFIQIPTTLLAQVDSSIGGKTGVDFDHYKNMVGAFHQPVLVYMNLHTLDTLTDDLFACGMGEVLKYGYIWDREFLYWLRDVHTGIRAGEPDLLTHMIHRSCEIKRDVVAEDPTEQGVRAILNFGHTVGHAIEKLKNFTLLHGQCVAIGCVAAARLSLALGFISEQEYHLVEEMNTLFQLPSVVEGLRTEDIYEATKKDKKMRRGKIRMVLLHPTGHAEIHDDISSQALLQAISCVVEEGRS